MKNKPPHLTETDQDLWDNFTKDVIKITSDRFIKQASPKIKPTIRERILEIPLPYANFAVLQLSNKDVRNINIDRSIDLHGLTEKEAKQLVNQFISKAYQQNLKWLLIVTGKGNPESPGILRKNLPDWLNELSALVVGYAPANIKDGGSGAFYVKIRRQKKNLK